MDENMLDYKVGHYTKYENISQSNKKNILRSFMFIKQKFFPDGNMDKFKARLVANGSQQCRHFYDSILSATVESMRKDTVFIRFTIIIVIRFQPYIFCVCAQITQIKLGYAHMSISYKSWNLLLFTCNSIYVQKERVSRTTVLGLMKISPSNRTCAF